MKEIYTEAWYCVENEDNYKVLRKWKGVENISFNKNNPYLFGVVLWKKTGNFDKSWNPASYPEHESFTFGKEITFEEFQIKISGINVEPNYEIY